jgi:ATP-dependent Clp protease ATP-binding subunit ClpC
MATEGGGDVERFDESARLAVVRGQEAARRANQSRIGTEFLLLGVMDVGNSVARDALAAMDVSPEDVRRDVGRLTGRGPEPPSAHIPFTPRSKKVLELSKQEAQQLGHEFVGTGHILLSLVREGGGVAARVLSGRGVDLDRLQAQVSRLVTDRSAGSPESGEAGRLHAENERLHALLRAHGIDPGTGSAG